MSNFYQSSSRLAKSQSDTLLGTLKFDSSKMLVPDHNFILCRDHTGTPTAIYSENRWSFEPVSTTPNSSNSILTFELKFKNIESKHFSQSLINQVKRILTILIYLIPKSGRFGSLSTKTLKRRFSTLMSISKFCLNMRENGDLLTELTINDLLSNANYLALFSSGLSNNQKSDLSDLIKNLISVDKKALGFELVKFHHSKPDSEQTALIPLPIYLKAFTNLHNEISLLYKHKNNLYEFIKEFSDSTKGLKKNTLKKNKQNFKEVINIKDLIAQHSLEKLFTERFHIKDVRNVVKAISSIQKTCKQFIHLLTGMRHGEVLHMRFNCLSEKALSNSRSLTHTKDFERTVNIISSSTKFSGYKKTCYWVAPLEITKAIEILQQITRGLAHIFGVSENKLPLFQSAKVISHKKSKPNKIIQSTDATVLGLTDIKINEKSRELLLASDTSRAFEEPQFQIGNSWKFTSHQFRRSLAYYGAHTGLISDSVGAKQFKQVTLEMQRYYRSGYSNIQSLFGFFNSETNEFEIPSDHFMYEFQTGITNEKSRSIIDSLMSGEKKYGKTGSYFSRIRERLNDDEVITISISKQIEDGSISYTDTLLGGCAKNTKCHDRMLGNFTACIDCNNAFISLDKLNDAIALCKRDLSDYPEGSAEFQLSSQELNALNKCKADILKKAKK